MQAYTPPAACYLLLPLYEEEKILKNATITTVEITQFYHTKRSKFSTRIQLISSLLTNTR